MEQVRGGKPRNLVLSVSIGWFASQILHMKKNILQGKKYCDLNCIHEILW